MKKFIIAVVAGLVFSSSAFAWGPREQGALAGIAGLWAFQQLQRAGQPQVIYQQTPPVIYQQTPPVIIQQPPVIYAPQPQQYCEYTVVTDQFGFQRSVPFCYYR
jgi:hypothetical protein